MEVKKFISKNFTTILLLILILLVVLQRCGSSSNGKIPKPTTDTVYSTQYHYYVDSGKSKPIFIKGERDTILESSVEYVPSDDYETLFNQFQELKEILLSRNIYKDQIKIDSFGTVDITDTLSQNKIVGRGFVNNIRIPEKTITITNTVPIKPKTKWFIGGGVGVSQDKVINDFNLGLAIINKKDQLFELKGRVDLKGKLYGELNSFWKIKLHK